MENKKIKHLIAIGTALLTIAVFPPSSKTMASTKISGSPIIENICAETKFKSSLLASKIKNLQNKTPQEKVNLLYEIFAVKNGGLRISDSQKDNRPPRDIDETITKGGDCSEFVLVIAASLKYLGLNGGALIVRIDGKEENDIHIVAYADIGEKIIIDPQADRINKILDGKKYKVLAELTLEQLKYVYFREYGDYYYNKQDYKKAIKKYEEAYCLYKEDLYVSYSLALSYQRIGNLKKAFYYATKFLNFRKEKLKDFFPKNHQKYVMSASRIIVEAKIEEGVEKYNSGNKEVAKKLFEEALEIGEKNSVIDNEEKEIIKNYIKNCE